MNSYKMAIQRGLMIAPAMIVEAADEKKAVEIARSTSGLGRFESWSFTPMVIRTKKVVTKKTISNE
jgi:hypothetical protein